MDLFLLSCFSASFNRDGCSYHLEEGSHPISNGEWTCRQIYSGVKKHSPDSAHLFFFFPIDLCTCLHYCPRHTACGDLFMESSPWWIILGLYLILPCLLRTWAPVLGTLQGLDGSGVLSNDQWLTLYTCVTSLWGLSSQESSPSFVYSGIQSIPLPLL